MKQVRNALIPAAAFLILAANASSQQQLRENLWAAWLGAALIVLAGLLCVGRRWMYFVFPLWVAILILKSGRALFDPTEYGERGPYWLSFDILYFVASYVAGWLYGTWSMLVPGTVTSAGELSKKSSDQPVQHTLPRLWRTQKFWIILGAIILAAFVSNPSDFSIPNAVVIIVVAACCRAAWRGWKSEEAGKKVLYVLAENHAQSESSFLTADRIKFCTQCGKATANQNPFCTNCGERTQSDAAAGEPIISSVSSTAHSAEASSQRSELATSQPKRIGGWLLFLCLFFAIVVPYYFLRNWTGAFAVARSSILAHLFAGFQVVLSLWSFAVGIKLWQLDPDAVKSAKRYLLFYLYYSIGESAVTVTLTGLSLPEEFLPILKLASVSLFLAAVAATVGTSYLNRSKRVRATFGGSASTMPAVTAPFASVFGPATTLAATPAQPIVQSVVKTPFQMTRLWLWIAAVIVIVVGGTALYVYDSDEPTGGERNQTARLPQPDQPSLSSVPASVSESLATAGMAFMPSDLRREEKFNDYAIRIYRNGGQNGMEGLEILKQGTRLYTDENGSFQIGGDEDLPVPIGADVTGLGVPDLVVKEYSGGAHCCTSVDVFELGISFRKIATIETADCDEVNFQRQNDGTYVFYGCDPAVKMYGTGNPDAAVPQVILRYANGSFHLAPDLMRKAPPSMGELKAKAAEIASSPTWSTQDTPGAFWGYVIDLTYSGNSLSADQFIELAWPTQRTDKDQRMQEFLAQLKKSPYWTDIQAFNAK